MKSAHLISILFLICSLDLYLHPNQSEILVNNHTQEDQAYPAMATDGSGNFIITWVSSSQDDGLPGIYARIFNSNGTPKSDEFKVNTFWAPHDRPCIAMARNGNFVIAWVNFWIEGRAGGGISARVFNRNGEPLGPEFLVNEYTSDYQGEPAVAMYGNGNFIVTWQSWGQDEDSFGIFARLFSPEGIPNDSDFQVNTYTADNQMHPVIAADRNGNFVIVWSSHEQDGNKTGIYAKRFDRTGDKLSKEFQINFTTKGWQDWPDISMDGLGNFVICWHTHQTSENTYDILARTFDKTGSLKGPEFRVNSYTIDWQVFPAICRDHEGNFLISWQSHGQDGNSYGIYAQRFDGFGQPIEEEFSVNLTTEQSQEFPDACIISIQNFIISWQSFHQTETGWNIFIRVFNSLKGHSRTLQEKQARKDEH